MNIKQRFKRSRFIKGEKKPVKSIVLSHKRIFILPSQRGLGFVLLIVLLLLISFVYNNNLAYFLTFLLVSVFFINILHSFKTLTALVLTQKQSQTVFAGDLAGFDILIENPTKIKRFNLQLSLENSFNFSVNEQENKRITLYSLTHKRGWHPIGTITLSSTYPLGLFRAWSPIRFAAKALVYPKPTSIEIPFPEAEGHQSQALNNNKLMGGDDFHGLVEYQKGDPVRHIHWKTFAKGQGLFIKKYAGNSLAELWLNYNQTAGQNVEERLSQLCRWVIDAEKTGLNYGFTIPGLKLKPGHGKAHYDKCLQALALF